MVATDLFTASASGPTCTGLVKLGGVTDNLGNAFIIPKLLTTKWPGAAVLMQFSEILMRRGLLLDLEWVPRDQNDIADRLANLDLEGFDPALRMEVDISPERFPLLHELLSSEASFRNELNERKIEKRAALIHTPQGSQEEEGPDALGLTRCLPKVGVDLQPDSSPLQDSQYRGGNSFSKNVLPLTF